MRRPQRKVNNIEKLKEIVIKVKHWYYYMIDPPRHKKILRVVNRTNKKPVSRDVANRSRLIYFLFLFLSIS